MTTAVYLDTRTWRDSALAGVAGRLLSHRLAAIGLLVILALAVAALFAPLLAPYNPAAQDYSVVLQGPSGGHWFGTDQLGRDVLSRLLYGARTSLVVGFAAQAIVLAIGVAVGLAAGLGGGRTDSVLMRAVDLVYAFPDLLLIILLRAVFGGNLLMLFVAMGLVNWATTARLVRAQALVLKQQEFVLSARAVGAGPVRIALHHMLPSAAGPVIVLATFGVPRAVFQEAALSFLGIGVSPGTASWGAMVRDGQQAIFASPHLVIFPALAIAIMMMAFTFLGDGLRDALDPRMAEGSPALS
ncbi:MAG: ABC transporter permease [Chloroflexi bacterium]|nr:ABC transporter permease [Chloroflexota bacterium]